MPSIVLIAALIAVALLGHIETPRWILLLVMMTLFVIIVIERGNKLTTASADRLEH